MSAKITVGEREVATFPRYHAGFSSKSETTIMMNGSWEVALGVWVRALGGIRSEALPCFLALEGQDIFMLWLFTLKGLGKAQIDEPPQRRYGLLNFGTVADVYSYSITYPSWPERVVTQINFSWATPEEKISIDLDYNPRKRKI